MLENFIGYPHGRSWFHPLPKRVSGIHLWIFSFVSSGVCFLEFGKLEADIDGHAFVDFIVR